jgi:hypothetical protein
MQTTCGGAGGACATLGFVDSHLESKSDSRMGHPAVVRSAG